MVKSLDGNLRFGFLVHDVSRLRRIVVDRALKPLGVTRSQWWVLAFLSRRDGMTQSALAVDLDLTRVAIGGLADRLETAGFIERRSDALDGRTRRVFLTRSGATLVGQIRKTVDDLEGQIIAKVSDEDFEQAARTLLTLKDTLLELAGTDLPNGQIGLEGVLE